MSEIHIRSSCGHMVICLFSHIIIPSLCHLGEWVSSREILWNCQPQVFLLIIFIFWGFLGRGVNDDGNYDDDDCDYVDDDDDYGNLHQSIVPAFPYLLAMSADTVEIRFLGFLAIIMSITITKIKKPKPSVTGILLNS